MLGSAFVLINFMEGLSLRSSIGGDFMYAEDYIYYGRNHMYGNSVGKLTDVRKAYSSIVTDNILNYRKRMSNGLALDVMLGHSFQQDVSSTASQTGQGFPSDEFDVNTMAAEYIDMKTGNSSWSIQSFMLRANLNYLDRYLVTLSARTDGSSKFAPKNRYGFFPSVSAGWNISKEKFWNCSEIDMKIRASVGMTGNQGGIGSYAWQPLANGGYNYLGESGIALMTQGNENLKWEKASQYNFGIDISFFDGRLTAVADIYRKDTKDLLYNKPISATSGFTNQICNIGAMRNDGLELTLGSELSSGDFRWKGGFNISFVRNRLTELIDDDGILTSGSYHALKVGEEVGSFYMIKMLGIYQSDDEVPARQYTQGVRAGDVIYEDVNNDGDIDTVHDSQFVGSANPLFTGGLSSTFTWKGFDLNILLAFSYGNMLYQTWTGGLRLGNGLWPSQKSEALARWTGPLTSNTVPRAIYGMTWNSTKFINSRYLHDASYLRCRNLSLGYSLPAYTVKRLDLTSLRIYIQGDNLFLISPYRFIDPEVNTSLDATKMGLDNMWLPQARTYTMGIKVKF
jgi:TonB-linked SusC/RagA family outer membrane protein